MFKNIKIENFRGIKELEIDDFKQVNLFVGGNNSGKTSVLEALYIALDPNNPTLADMTNQLRGMSPSSFRSNNPDYSNLTKSWIKTMQSLFYQFDPEVLPVIDCSFDDKSKETQKIKLELLMNDSSNQEEIPDLIYHFSSTAKSLKGKNFQAKLISEKALISTSQNQLIEGMQIRPIIDEKYKELRFQKRTGRFISALIARDLLSLKNFFDEVIQTTKKKNKLIKVLQRLEPKLIGIVFTHAFYAELEGFNEAVRLESLGDGTLKLFAIALICIYDEKSLENGVLFIDELENGLHYSSQDIIWDFLLNLQKEYKTQIFATTHSMDSVKAFVNASKKIYEKEKDPDQARLYRLEKCDEEMIATKYTQEDLETSVLEMNLNVR